MKSLHVLITITLCFFFSISSAQFFRASFEVDGMDLIFNIQPNPGGGDITTGWSDIEFFVRYPDIQAGSFSFGAITINTTDFPGISIPDNGADAQGSETGFENNWFGTSFTATANQTYTEGQVYEVFRVAVSVDPSTIDFELVANEFFFPHYLALTSQAGGDLTSSSGNKFYGNGATSCTNCPQTSTNYLLPLPTLLPAELVHFDVEKINTTDAFIQWQTTSEINVSHFELERSLDGQNWEVINEVTARGNTFDISYYQSTDRDVNLLTSLDNPWMYYRLKTVDFDQRFEYSSIKNIQFENDNQIAVFPNPVEQGNLLNINLNQNLGQGIISIEIYQIDGTLLFQKKTENPIGETIKINSDFPAGTYMLRLVQGYQSFSQSFLIIH